MPDRPSDVDTPGVARRRFLTRGAIAAAVAASGAAVLASEPAGAANGGNIVIGSGGDANNTGTTTTTLSGSQFHALNGNASISLVGEHTSANAVGVEARSADGAQLRMPPNGVNPAADVDAHTYDEGSLIADSTNQLLWYTWAGGTGGQAGTARNFPLNGFGGFVPLDKPVRQYDSRPGQPPTSNVPPSNTTQKTPLNGVPFGERTIWVVNTSAVAIIAVLLNVTVVDTVGQGFLAVRAADVAWDSTHPFSNMNWYTNGQITANVVVSGVDSDGQVTIRVGSPPPTGSTNVIVDLLGAWVYP